MFDLKPISRDAVPRALTKAERYRMLNEPKEAVSICRDVLAVDPANQEALVNLILALSDQFGEPSAPTPAAARELLPKLKNPYARSYYAGVIAERYAKGLLESHASVCPGHVIYSWFVEAMEAFDEAHAHAEPGNDDAVLRWNACARAMQSHPHVRPSASEMSPHDTAMEDVPDR